jgi:hypothetical protein
MRVQDILRNVARFAAAKAHDRKDCMYANPDQSKDHVMLQQSTLRAWLPAKINVFFASMYTQWG